MAVPFTAAAPGTMPVWLFLHVYAECVQVWEHLCQRVVLSGPVSLQEVTIYQTTDLFWQLAAVGIS